MLLMLVLMLNVVINVFNDFVVNINMCLLNKFCIVFVINILGIIGMIVVMIIVVKLFVGISVCLIMVIILIINELMNFGINCVCNL